MCLTDVICQYFLFVPISLKCTRSKYILYIPPPNVLLLDTLLCSGSSFDSKSVILLCSGSSFDSKSVILLCSGSSFDSKSVILLCSGSSFDSKSVILLCSGSSFDSKSVIHCCVMEALLIQSL